MDAIQLEHVSKVYRVGAVETYALRDITLSIAEGEFTALVGPSGSGKTTLLQLIGCLDRPDEGTVRPSRPPTSTPPTASRRWRLWSA